MKAIRQLAYVGALVATAAFATSAQAQNPEQLHQNAMQRCANLTGGYQQACLDRVHGKGEHVGSVEGGGMLHSSEVAEPAGGMAPGGYKPRAVEPEHPKAAPKHPAKHAKKMRPEQKRLPEMNPNRKPMGKELPPPPEAVKR